MPSIKINDIEMYYEAHGEGEALVLIAGFTCNRLVWQDHIAPLAKHFQVIVFDNRGAGETTAPKEHYTMAQFAADTVGLLNALNIPSAHFLGHSMGGMIIQQICLDYPTRIKKGILCASCAKVPPKALMQMEITPLLRNLEVSREFILKNAFPWFFSNAFLNKRENIEPIIHKMLHDPCPQTPVGYLGQSYALHQFDSSAHLSSIRTPLLIISGDEDILTPLSCSQFLATQIPQAQLTILPGQAHLLIEEAKEQLAELTLTFLKN